LARHCACRSNRLIDSLGEREAIGVVGARDNTAVSWIASVEAMEISAVERENRSAERGRPRQDVGVRNSLIGPMVGARRQHIVAECYEEIHERCGSVFIGIKGGHASLGRLVPLDRPIDFLGMHHVVVPGRVQIISGQ
jgi:hypothetical protein